MRFILLVAAMYWLDLAAWTWHRPLGMAAIGVSLLVLEWAIKRDDGGGEPRRRP